MNLNTYQQILFQDTGNNSSPEIQRKCIAQMLKASCSSLDNASTCYLLNSQLNQYSATVEKEHVYETHLNQLLANKTVPKEFKSNLDRINGNSFLKPLPCATDKNSCNVSERFNNVEFQEFLEEFRGGTLSRKTTNTIPSKRKENHIKSGDAPNLRKNYPASFKTARDELHLQNIKKYGNSCPPKSNAQSSGLQQKRKLGTRRNINSKFVSPLLLDNESNEDITIKSDEWDVDERLKNIEPKMVALIKAEIMDCSPNIHWHDIAGLDFAKTTIQESVVWPLLRPDIFTGLRRPPKGILLFGPPGTGKTLIGKCVASQSKATFFSISASSLTSKWIGEGEKMVRALFTVARVHQPAVIFIDEVDSLLSQRSDSEHESSRRIKTEFLVQLDGATTDNEERILVVGATNRPQELDEAARRRFVKRLYIPLPEYQARLQLLQKLIAKEHHQLVEADFETIAGLCEGYSGADIRNLCSEASLEPIRSIDVSRIEHIQASDVRPLLMEDFRKALATVRTSVSPKDLEQYVTWNGTYGSGV